ncbi:MAG TPA: hypothetical protein VGU27_09095, partial [Candidatus Eisenbacteria bacterium]|nr:hypothetical protein [Candidatus Eisenbacteria bacterium]
MLATLTVPALALLLGFPGLGAFKGLPWRNPKSHAQVAAADTLPPPWKPWSRLALEDQFVTAGLPRLGPRNAVLKVPAGLDPRVLHVDVEADSSQFVSSVEVGSVQLGPALREPLDEYSAESFAGALSRKWLDLSHQKVNSLGALTPVQHSGLSLPLPVQLPSRIQSILGPGGPALNVSGSESITLSGTSNWTNSQVGLLGQRRSLFPSLNMQQNLDVQLEGQLSDRIKVNLLQNSANQVPLSNRIAINYKGDEDDVVQELDLGNTNLSLPGTQYVSYSGKNEGLFGVKVASRMGPLDFTALASKQEGRSERASYGGATGHVGQDRLYDFQYVHGQYFLLYDPNRGVFDVPDSSIRVYLDDANSGDDHNVLSGLAVNDPDHALGMGLPPVQDTSGVFGNFDLLQPGPDQQYDILPDVYAIGNFTFKVLHMRQPVTNNQVLAVTYRVTPLDATGRPIPNAAMVPVGGRFLGTAGPDSGRTLLKLLRAPASLQAKTPDSRFYDDSDSSAFAPARELELKNFYQLGGLGIDPKTFKFSIELGQQVPPVTGAVGAGDTLVNYIEVLGLDNFNESTGQPIAGHDGQVDGAAPNSRMRLFVDYKNGVVFLPDPHPFAPRLRDPRFPFDALVDTLLLRRVKLNGPPGSDHAPDPGPYTLTTPQPQDASYTLVAQYSSQRAGNDIELGRGNILQGSEAVVVNGERWVRDRDYTIDYDLGRITLKRSLGASDQLNVDYSYAPLFQQAGRTLIGSAFRLEGREKSVGGAFLYQSQGAQDLRPRLGEEPSRTVISDLNTEWHFHPDFLTRMADALPGLKTTTPSELNVQAEVGASLPNPNTLNQVYIDDMEGVRDAVSLSLTPDHWRWSSVPSRATSLFQGRATSQISFQAGPNVAGLPNYSNAEIHWFTPPTAIKEKELRPNLTDAQGGQNPHQALAMSLPRYPVTAPANDTLWAGLTYVLDQVGIDLSRSQFIDLWVNDWVNPRVRGGPGLS